ncbi:MAG: tyrosine-type recombinase/integrase [Gammaproteobacteria bacterium]
MQAKITKTLLTNIKPQDRAFYIYDQALPGFGLEVKPSGRRSFIVNVRQRGEHTRRLVLREYPIIGLDEARDKALGYIKLLREGRDPREVHGRGQTLGAVLDALLANRSLKPKTAYDYRSTCRVCFPDWLAQPITIINRSRIEDRFHKLVRERGKAQAAKAMRLLSTLCNDAVASELIPDNPVVVLAQKRIDRSIKPRDRYLPFNLFPDFLAACRGDQNPVIGDYLQLLLLTGLRRAEAAGLLWADIGPESFKVRDTKNGTDHTLPMVDVISAIFHRRRSLCGGERSGLWVFPNKLGTRPLAEPQKAVKRISERIGFGFTCHDLRRIFASVAHHVGIDYVTVQRLLNHKNKSITERYIQHNPDQLRKPLQRCCDFVVNTSRVS